MATILLRNRAIPFRAKYKELEQYLDLVKLFPPFQTWQSNFSKSFDPSIDVKEVLVQDVDFFGNNRLGFVKFKVDLAYNDGVSIPGIVFSRGPSVAIFVVLKTGEEDPWVVLVKQPRVPIGSMGFLELPAGMIDGNSSFSGVAAQELKEECGIEIKEADLVLMSTLAVSPGGCDETLLLYKLEIEMDPKEAVKLNGQLGGLREHGERIGLELCRKSKLTETKSLSILAALALYDNMHK